MVPRHTAPDVTPSIAIVRQVAERKGVGPAELEPIFEYIQPEALDHLVESGFDGWIRFIYAGYSVRVDGDGTIQVDLASDVSDDSSIGESGLDES